MAPTSRLHPDRSSWNRILFTADCPPPLNVPASRTLSVEPVRGVDEIRCHELGRATPGCAPQEPAEVHQSDLKSVQVKALIDVVGYLQHRLVTFEKRLGVPRSVPKLPIRDVARSVVGKGRTRSRQSRLCGRRRRGYFRLEVVVDETGGVAIWGRVVSE